jgi:hypothetical protein
MTNPNFEILFTGLCAFVEKVAEGAAEAPGKSVALLVDSTEPPDLPHDHQGKLHEPHVPVLICAAEAVAEGSRNPDAFYEDEYRQAIFFLDDQDVDIVGGALPESSSAEAGEVKAEPACPNADNKRSNYWITRLQKISPGSEYVDRSCLAPDGVHSAVVARVWFASRPLKAAQLAIGRDQHVMVWNFKVPGDHHAVKSHRQAAASIVGFDVKAPTITMETKLLRASSNPRVIEIFKGSPKYINLKFVDKPKRNIVWIKDMPWADILGTRTPDSYEQGPDVHFAHFYKLCGSYVKANVPHPDGLCYETDLVHQGNPNCQPVLTK